MHLPRPGTAFRSPFVNLFITAPDYIRFLQAPREYLEAPLVFHPTEQSYPVAQLKDITIHFMHYHTPEEAESAWRRRTRRINWENLFILMTDQDGCTGELMEAFDALPYQHKIIFTHLPHPQIRSAVYIPGFEQQEAVGNCDSFRSPYRGKKYFDSFDYVNWFNGGV